MTLHVLETSEIPDNARRGLIIDCETTGLDPDKHEILELCLLLFAFDPCSMTINGIVDEYCGLQEPEGRISREASAVHGITRRMTKGQVIDESAVETLALRTEFYVSHNTEFDGLFAGRFLPSLKKRWYCSLNHIPWAEYGCSRRGLAFLLKHHAIDLPQAHRASPDAHALLELLNHKTPSGETYLAVLLRHGEKILRQQDKERAEREAAIAAEVAKVEEYHRRELEATKRIAWGFTIAIIGLLALGIYLLAKWLGG